MCALQEDIVLPHVAAAGADTAAASVSVQAWRGGVPTDNCISGVATYTLPSGQPRTTSFQVSLLHHMCFHQSIDCMLCQVMGPLQWLWPQLWKEEWRSPHSTTKIPTKQHFHTIMML